jgi:hypothetical protein
VSTDPLAGDVVVIGPATTTAANASTSRGSHVYTPVCAVSRPEVTASTNAS